MKHIIRSFVFHIVALWFTTEFLPTMVVIGSWQSFVLAGFILTLLMLFIQPMLKILFIPINFITFGLLSWLVNVIIIYLLTILVPEVEIHEWTFPGTSMYGFVVPAFHLSYLYSLIASTFLVSLVTNILHSLSDD